MSSKKIQVLAKSNLMMVLDVTQMARTTPPGPLLAVTAAFVFCASQDSSLACPQQHRDSINILPS